MSKQAVLIIHGIGNQRPMQTLRGFVQAVWSEDTGLHRPHDQGDSVWSKPYPLSQNFELRRLTTAENRAGLKTDFFEFYWAHLMQGTRLAHVWAWLRSLLWRSPSRVPASLRVLYAVLWLVVVVALGVSAWSAWQLALDQGPPWWLKWLLALAVVPAVTLVLTDVVGDAARYLHVDPANIQARHAIRSAGLEALKSLHDRGYDRIVLVGHSLGTVIAYDILTHAWADAAAREAASDGQALQALQALEDLASQGVSDPVAWQAAQRALFNRRKEAGCAWRVTDFVSLGSPLAHAPVLLADDAADLQQRLAARELLGCPPLLETTTVQGQAWAGFSWPAAARARRLHHAAVFACTRWTNLYFPCKALLVGDLVAGPLAPVLGSGIRDVAVHTRRWFGLLSHNFYWRPHAADEHVRHLREALDLLDQRGRPIP